MLDSTIVFSELMYNPVADEQLEWIELHNEMAVDMDISEWRLDGVGYEFPVGTVVSAGDRIVVARNPDVLRQATSVVADFGPFAGRLDNAGERLRLLNNVGRVMDVLDYQDAGDWPVGSDGSGATLAKWAPDGGSQVGNWRTSRHLGGTPGTENFPTEPLETSTNLVTPDQLWHYQAGPVVDGVSWQSVDFDPNDPNRDGDFSDAWQQGRGIFATVDAGLDTPVATILDGDVTTYYFRTEFEWSGDSTATQLTFDALVDDGAIAYLNGEPIWRVNLLGDGVAVDTVTSESVDVATFSGATRVDRRHLRMGTNVLAVEVHQGVDGAQQPPPKRVLDLRSEPGFLFTWTGTDGQFFDHAAPLAGAIVPENEALAARGAVAFASSDLGPEIDLAFHRTTNLNDGHYGNSHSWIGGTSNPFAPERFAGVRFPQAIEIETVAWGRDNGNNVSDACGGQCRDRSGGKYELQFTRVADANEATPQTGDANTGWQSIGTATYGSNEDDEPGEGFTIFLRHEYNVRANGDPILATAIRILVPATGLNGGTAIDEIEVYAVRETDATSEVHDDTSDLAFAAALHATEVPAAMPRVSLSEVAGEDGEFFVEVENRYHQPLDLSGYTLQRSRSLQDTFVLPALTLEPQQRAHWTSSQLGFSGRVGDRLFLIAPDDQSLVDAVRIERLPQVRVPEHGIRWLTTDHATPGDTNVVPLEDGVVINEIVYHAAGTAVASSPESITLRSVVAIDDETLWRYYVSAAGLPTTWATVEHSAGVGGWQEGPALLGKETTPLAEPIRTELPVGRDLARPITTYYFEREFEFTQDTADSNVDLVMRHIVDDGAVFHLNGQEFHRFRMRSGNVNSTTRGRTVGNAKYSDMVTIPAELLKPGKNRISVEVHQSNPTSNDMVFGLEILELTTHSEFVVGEPYRASEEEWIEVYNRSDREIDLTGWQIDRAVDFMFPTGTKIGPGEYRVIAWSDEDFRHKYPQSADYLVGEFSGGLSNSDEAIRIVDALGNPADEVHYFDGGRWDDRADGGNASLELIDADADNAVPESWQAGLRVNEAEWQTVRYTNLVAADFYNNNDVIEKYHEFIFGMLDKGTVLIDDVSVIEDPGDKSLQRIQNGTFDTDLIGTLPDKWRISGNHSGQVIQDPDDPTNQVLLLTATGAAEDRVNHAETTFADGALIGRGSVYEISFRAKWVSGSNQLNSHLYFDRLGHTSLLERPSDIGTPGQINSVANLLGPTFTDFSHAPAIPNPFESVQVSVNADDPDGVRSAVLRYAVDDGDFESVEMTRGVGRRLQATIPGQRSGRTVQFYVEAVDGSGHESYFPATGPGSRALYRVQDHAAREGLHNFRILMTEADTDRLHDPTQIMSNGRLKATVYYNESEVFYDVGVRLKGSNAARGDANYLGYNIEFDPMQPFRGVHHSVAIDRSGRSFNTPFTQDEILIKHLGTRAGDAGYMYDDLVHVIAPRPQDSRSALLLMARYGDVFLDSQFENGSDGTVFKLDIAYVPNGTVDGDPESLKIASPYSHPMPAKDLWNFGPDKEAYRTHLLIRNNRSQDDYSAVIRAGQTLEAARAVEELAAVADTVIDVDQWSRVLALQSLTGAVDAYSVGGLHHNISFYVHPGDERLRLLPWDWDFAFSASPTQILHGSAGVPGRLMRVPSFERLLHGHLWDIIQVAFNNEYLDPWIDHYGEVAGQDLTEIKSWVAARKEHVLEKLPDPIAFEVTTNNGLEMQTDASTVQLTGRGWIDVREIRRVDTQQSLPVEWSDEATWNTSVSLTLGVNEIRIQAFDHRDNLVGEDTIRVTSSVGEGLLEGLRITEINYHPADPTPVEIAALPDVSAEDFEFIEFMNVGDVLIDLAGVRLSNGLEFEFADITLAPSARIVVAQDVDAFRQRYGEHVSIAGQFLAGRLSNGGEQLRVESGLGRTLIEFAYDDDTPWPTRADGGGSTLELIDLLTPSNQLGDPASWRASSVPGGSPGSGPGNSADFSGDDRVDTDDIDLLCHAIGQPRIEFDLNADGIVSLADLTYLIESVLGTKLGDTNLDGRFESIDLVELFLVGEYEDDVDRNSTWADGDRNCDGEFTSEDIVAVFHAGGYVPTPAAKPRHADLALAAWGAEEDDF